ncbi:triple tyrosine motif-containing protein [Niveispirillum sp. KHB5.9]|uniref:sensor histidine kinase n=1 Tax=Niveispirillum sp. KHB5.9 TaxID=3400269 RepID=UPI003A8AB081
MLAPSAAVRKSRSLFHAILAAIVALIAGAPAGAQFVTQGLPQFTHTRWTVDDGAPTGISDIVQTPDGWLWLASTEGLYRFDGVSFERIAAPAGSPMERSSPSTLLIARSGELWVGYSQNGGVAVYRDGRLVEMPMESPPSRIVGLAQTPDGAIWATAATSYRAKRLYRWFDGNWASADPGLGLPEGFVGPPCVTRDGTLWITLNVRETGALASLSPGAQTFRTSPFPVELYASCSVDREGRLWIADPTHTQLRIGSDGKVIAQPISYPAVPDLEHASLAFDAAGGLWGSTNAVGLFYIPAAADPNRTPDHKLERFLAANGLNSNVTRAPFVDREGNIWFGADVGLDRFRPSSAERETRIGANAGRTLTMSASLDDIFVSTDNAVFQLTSAPPRKILDYGLMGMCPARGGGYWGVGSPRSAPTVVFHFNNGKRTEFAVPLGVQLIGTCAEDGGGLLWVGIMPGSAMWHDGDGWHHLDKPGPVMHEPDLVVTPEGDVAYVAAREIVRLSPAGVRTISLEPYDIGAISKLTAGLHDLFVSGNNGLLRIRGDQIARIDARRFPWVARLRGLVQTAAGETWMRRIHWISRVSTADLDHAFDDPDAPLDRRYYDLRDGLGAAQNAAITGVQLGVGGDGRVALLEKQGLSFLDPGKLTRNMSPPPVVIRSLSSNGAVHRDPGRLILPAGTRSMEIAYASLSFVAPHRAEFRYRLEGVDDDWVSAGTRRMAAYSNLGPGTYRFQVIAANSDGVWNEKGAALEFEIRPTFFQSWPFKLLCALIVLTLLWVAYSIRMRTIAHRIRLRMAERIEERERIARELHDTLLQSIQSLTLRFQLAVDGLPARADTRLALEAAIDRADQVIAEGRDRVLELRLQQETRDIETILADLVKRQGFDPGITVSISTDGTRKPLAPLVLDEVCYIAGEALYNIWRHAAASRVMIEIGYHSEFSLRFMDDGVGIDPMVAQQGAEGHFGLSGMRERAQKLGGRLVVRQRAEGGSEVALIVLGALAYKTREPGFLSLLRRQS